MSPLDKSTRKKKKITLPNRREENGPKLHTKPCGYAIVQHLWDGHYTHLPERQSQMAVRNSCSLLAWLTHNVVL